MTAAQTVDILTSPWDSALSELAASATISLLILSPYITRRPVERLLEIIRRQRRDGTLRLRLVTDLSPPALSTEAIDVGALLLASQALPAASVTHLPRLHAKVYIADTTSAIVTSGNLTEGGLASNYEFGLRVSDPCLVSRLRADAEGYAQLGADVTREALGALAAVAARLVSLRRQADRDISRGLRHALRAQSRAAEVHLLRARARGRTTHGIFADTLLYLLRSGSQRTVDLHRMVQRIHPDLCDDSVERVIDGVHFGKKWKHHLRTAQQHLKRRGLIAHEGGSWYRVDRSDR
jgi:hypothetical protein